jgi:NiFe hydrogenase small subunit HydA
MAMVETFYDVIRRQGISRRSFLKFCSLTAASLGLGPSFAPRIAHAMETKPRIPVLWLHGLECTCCSESFIRSAHPLVKGRGAVHDQPGLRRHDHGLGRPSGRSDPGRDPARL